MDGRQTSPRKSAAHGSNRSSRSTNPSSPSKASFEAINLSLPHHRQPYARTPSFEPPSLYGSSLAEAASSSRPNVREGALTVDFIDASSAQTDESTSSSCHLQNAPAGRAVATGNNPWWPDGSSSGGGGGGGGSRSSTSSNRSATGPYSAFPAQGIGRLASAEAIPLVEPTYSNGHGHRGASSASQSSNQGYSSSTEGEVYPVKASRLTSRTATPLTGIKLADRNGHVGPEETESDGSDYDERTELTHGRGNDTPKGAVGMLGSLGKSLSDRGFWTVPGGGSNGAAAARARNSKSKKWSRSGRNGGVGGQDRTGLLSSGSPASSAKLRRRSNAALAHPFRLGASFCSKLFRTFFGPIHPVTILVALVLIASIVASVTKLIIYILNPDKEPLPWRTYCQQQPPFPHAYADALAPVDVFVGVFSVDSAYERRHLIRSTYAAHTSPVDPHTGLPTANVQVRFVIGRPRKAHARRVALEMEVFNDLVILDMEENMNNGKTHSFFKWAADNATVPFLRPLGPSAPAASAGGQRVDDGAGYGQTREVIRGDGEHPERYEVAWKKADYVVKADDDAFIVLEELERHLRVSPRQMTYWGYLIRNWFMGGECYALSSDLVQYVATSESVLHHVRGKEDKQVAQWINLHPNRADINWVSEHCWIYDHPKAGTAYSHGFLFPDHVEKIRLEGRRGLSDEEVARRGGEHRSKSYSTVSRWHQTYTEPRGDLTVEEEVEALVEGGGRWSGTWVRGEEGNSTQAWVPHEQIVYEANDDRLRSSQALNVPVHMTLAEEVSFDAETGLTIRRTRSSNSTTIEASSGAAASLKARDGHQPPRHGALTPEQRRAHVARAAQPRLVPAPSHKDGNGEADALRSQRYLGRRFGGTVVVHFLKKSEWFYETALALSGRSKSWPDGAGGSGTEWRMYGSPLVRHEDSYVSDGRSQPRPDLEVAYLEHARVQAQANAAQAQGQAARVGSFTKPRSLNRQIASSPPPPARAL